MHSRVQQLHFQAASLMTKFQEGGGSDRIDCAIGLDREALELCPPGHPERADSLTFLAVHLGDRYRHLGAMKDLEEAIALSRETLTLSSQGRYDRSVTLNTLSVCLSFRHEQLGMIEDLHEAITLAREVLEFRSQGHPQRWTSLSNLGDFVSARYDLLGNIEDLYAAIAFAREALGLCPKGHSARPTSLNNLAVYLCIRYKQLGTMSDLDEAIVLHREAIDLHPHGHQGRTPFLINLALCLFTRYEQLRAMEDLDHAIILGKEALHLHPQGHPARSTSLNNLAVHLFSRYKRVEKTEDLDEVIALDKAALDLRQKGHPLRPTSLGNLAVHLYIRYEKLAAVEDLDESIVLDQEALTLRPPGHPDRSMSLNNLAIRLAARHKRGRAMKDLDDAILLVRDALQLRPTGHPTRSQSLVALARYLQDRYACSSQPEDMEESFKVYAELVHTPHVASSSDLAATKAWIHAAESFSHPTTLLAYETSLRLLVQNVSTLPSLPQHLVIIKDLTSSLAVDAFSACLRKHAPEHAVELLEQGRGVFWSQLTRLESPLADVIASGTAGKSLADEFTRLTTLIRNTLNSSDIDQHEQMYHLNIEMQGIVTNIRELPGCSRFLLPLLYADLRLAADSGPVIIVNASQYSCDALIVLRDRDPVHIPLLVTQENVRDLATELRVLSVRATRANATRELASFLRKLWDQFVSRIVEVLQTILPSKSRIWWCPTAEFSFLPLHAAGPFRKGQRNLPDLYISSYTPTLVSLIRARRHSSLSSTAQERRFIAVGQAKAAGESELGSVGAELENIRQCIDGLVTFTRIDGESSSISRVVEELSENEWVHLACHGLPNRKQPFESAFALRDGHFTVQQIIGCDLKNPEFAYLSACHTTVGYEERPDEAIHLASAMQFAGFRSVIGTLWAVDDGETNKITPTFYKHVVNDSGRLDHTRAAFALNKTMKSVNVPLDQRILYIHLGA